MDRQVAQVRFGSSAKTKESKEEKVEELLMMNNKISSNFTIEVLQEYSYIIPGSLRQRGIDFSGSVLILPNVVRCISHNDRGINTGKACAPGKKAFRFLPDNSTVLSYIDVPMCSSSLVNNTI